MSWWWDEKNLWILASFLEARLKVSNPDLGSRKWPCLELPGFGRTRPCYTVDLATRGTCRSRQHCHGVWYAPAWPPFPSFNCPQCPLCHLSPLYSHAWPLNSHSGANICWREAKSHGRALHIVLSSSWKPWRQLNCLHRANKLELLKAVVPFGDRIIQQFLSDPQMLSYGANEY